MLNEDEQLIRDGFAKLFKQHNPIMSWQLALAIEKALARELQQKGCAVWSN